MLGEPTTAADGVLGDGSLRTLAGTSQRIKNADKVCLVHVVGMDKVAAQLTVAMAIDAPGGGQPLPPPPAVGLLQWGTDGAQLEAEVDFINGAVISVAGSFVRLQVQFEQDPKPEKDVEAVVKASAGYYPARGARPTRTLVRTVPASGAVEVAIPRMASSFLTLQDGTGFPGAVAVGLEFLDRTPAVIALLQSPGGTDPVSPVFQIPNAARFVRVGNIQGTAVTARVIFNLTI